MGIIVGQQTYVECDVYIVEEKRVCRNRSVPSYSQTKAVDNAKRAYWYISPTTGMAICPECRRQQERNL